MYIFDKTITEYTKEIMSELCLSSLVAPARPPPHLAIAVVLQAGPSFLNYYTVLYIQQEVINKLKVRSTVGVVKM